MTYTHIFGNDTHIYLAMTVRERELVYFSSSNDDIVMDACEVLNLILKILFQDFKANK